MARDMNNIPQTYMSSQYTGFWVAEAILSPGASLKSPIQIIRGSQPELFKFEGMQRRIVGTAAVIVSDNDTDAAWLRRMAVVPEYQKRGIASALIDEVVEFCKKSGYTGIELVTTECHKSARSLYAKKGFQLRQLYHKQLLLSFAQILMYEYVYNLQ